MGLANLVPGISGGTMLLAAGIYPQFIAGVAEVTTFRFRPRTIAFLGIVVVAALVAIGALAKPVSFLVTNHRWAMYSLFIGLTLGGVPILWRLLRPMDARAWIAAAAGIAAMIGLTLWERAGAGAVSNDDGHAYLILVIAGIAGGSAMILPGVSGAYLLLVLGQYLVILGAISEAVDAVRARAWSDVLPAMHVFVPVGIGVVIGVVGVSNLLKYLLARHQRLTLGVLLGFLLGAVVGLWPFQAPSPPAIGDAVKGVVLATQADVDLVDPEDWPARFFTPSAIQVAGAAGCIIAGFLISLGTSRLGGRDPGGPAA
jgi:putative membrane protein